jgi:redox-sensitive bicupin YhaK (pirin superfamily)
MITIRRSQERGHANHGWLDSYHSFSFADYYDPRHMGVSVLRVINEDRVEAGAGFPSHPHRDMEIISYVLDGALEHRDSMGNGSVIRPGDVQRMSAGTGVIHSEFNASDSEAVHFLQIWIVPSRRGLPPGYQQEYYPAEEKRGKLRLVASPDGQQGSLTIHQDMRLYAMLAEQGEAAEHVIDPGRCLYLHVASGALAIGDTELHGGDGATIYGQQSLGIEGVDNAEFLLFDLPAA